MSTSVVPLAARAYLEREDLQSARVVRLTGDASDRRYFRVFPPSGDPFVLAVHAEAFDYQTLPFVNVTALFDAMPVRVPRILGHAEDLGILALEDLGDVTLQAHLGAADDEEHEALYHRAVDIIHRIQTRGRELTSERYVPYGIAFDVEKLTWEFDYFVRHFVEGYRGATIEPGAREALEREFGAIAAELAAEPRVLCHRDYHSRNLMFRHDELVVIDHQDARMGPDTYDLVSLLRDAYVDLPESTVDALIDHALALRDDAVDRTEFRRRFDLMALQRTVKALGTFGYQASERNNPVYIQYIPRTLAHVASGLAADRRFARLQELLGALLPEVR